MEKVEGASTAGTEPEKTETSEVKNLDDLASSIIEAVTHDSVDKKKVHLPIGPFLLDIFLCSLVGLVVILARSAIRLSVRHEFHCLDRSLRYAYYPSTVRNEVLWGVIAGLVVLPTLFVETLRLIVDARFHHKRVLLTGEDVIGCLIRMCSDIGSCMLGLVVNLTIVTLTKCYVGGLRPHFYHLCFEETYGVKCDYRSNYTRNYNCTDHNRSAILDAQFSFFSAQASLSMHVAFFAVLLVQGRFPVKACSGTFRAVLQLALVSVSLFIGCKRISDNISHPSDVIAGFACGLLTSTYSAVQTGQVFGMLHIEMELKRVRSDLATVPP